MALASVATAVALAFVAQLIILGALGIGPDIDQLEFESLVNVQSIRSGTAASLRFDASRGPAVAQTRILSQHAGKVLAITLKIAEGDGPARLALGWRVAEDSRRPTSAGLVLANQRAPRDVMIPMVGHPRWQGSVTQMALALETGKTAQLVIAAVSIVPANPIGGGRLMAASWFGEPDAIAAMDGAAVRVLPLALWIAFIAVISAIVATLWSQRQPEQRAQALRLVALLVATLALTFTVLGSRWPGWTVAIIGAAAITSALLLAGAPVAGWTLPMARWPRHVTVALLFALGTALSPVVASIAAIPMLILLVSGVWPTWMPAAASLLALLPPLAIAAAAQRLVTLPGFFSPLVDPTNTLLTVANSAAGLPGIAVGLITLHRLWPAPALAPRWASGPGAAAVWAVTGAVCVLAVPRLAVLVKDGSAYIGLLLPALACLSLAAAPRFRAVAATIAETAPGNSGKTESDLSDPALALLHAYSDSLQHGIATQQAGVAHNALAQMMALAPQARLTSLARLQLALAERNLVAAQAAATAVSAQSALNEAEYEALFDLAHRLGEHRRVIELGPHVGRNLNNTRAIALARLITAGPAAAIQTLTDASDGHVAEAAFFAQEIAELHLLANDVPAAQKALAASGIPFKSETGEAYVNRLGWRAAGIDRFGEAIQRMTTWHQKLAVAQAAMGELLMQQGNFDGARARFRLAMQMDVRLWPLALHLEQPAAHGADGDAVASATT